MKRFEISGLIISKINDVYSFKLKKHTTAESVFTHSVLIIKQGGLSTYKVAGKEYSASSETVLFFPEGTAYSLDVERFGGCTVIEFDAANPASELTPTEFSIGENKEIAKAATSVAHFWALKGPAYHSKCLSEIYGIITRISNEHAFATSLAGKYGLIHRSVKYIENNYTNPDLYTSFLAEMSGMGETYYRNIFIAVFNTPPTKYIQQYRIDKAKELLVNSELSVDEIAIKVGFANASYFCKVFKSLTGMTPSDFAAKGRKIG
ncbi:MAG: helix-turn-helix transcriptional regulator [Ruminococcaceae bacterium]|nr:helix-turn-helix transcriptional regulator [Oscillospiraceae bacterium]